MKNKHKIVVSLAVLITLALLTLTGCSNVVTTYDLSKLDTVTLSDAIVNVLPSCVVVNVKGKWTNHTFSCVGIAIEKNKVLVPVQAIGTSLTDNYIYTGQVYGSNAKISLVEDEAFNNKQNNILSDVYNNRLAVRVLLVETKNVELVPVQFGDSDNLEMGTMLFGISYDPPIIDSSYEKTSEVVADYLLTNSVMVASKYMDLTLVNRYFLGVTDELQATSFTTQSYFNSASPPYKHAFSSLGISDNSNTKLSVTNYWLFNREGQFVGANYFRVVDKTTENKNVVLGIGYAYSSNGIRQAIWS